MSNSLSNQYYLYIHPEREPIPWNPLDLPPMDWINITYYSKVFEAMEKNLKGSDLVFYFTWDRVYELPSYGSNVVAIVVGDEWSRIPTYSHKVRAVFQCLSTRPMLGCNPLLKPSYLNLLTLIQFLRIWVLRLPGVLNYWFHKFKSLRSDTARITHIYDIPQGYGKQLELPIKELEARLYDVFFAGSVEHKTYSVWSLKKWVGTPKVISRQKMILSINRIKKKYPTFRFELSITPYFGATISSQESIYSEKMMDTKICLVPRGTSFETLRFFEAMRYGCIVVMEALPSRWFYEGSPAIQIKDWSELEEVLENLVENKHFMQEKHQEALKWWEAKCSEATIGAYIAEKLNEIQKID